MQILGPVYTPPGSLGAKIVIIPATPPVSAGAHRYWRLYITASATASPYPGFSEIELRSSTGGADLTGSGTASASASESGHPASSAVDNNTGTFWATYPTTPPVWWAYDFGSGVSHNIIEIQITPRTDAYRADGPGTFEFQFSDDGSNWTTISVVSGLTWPNTTPQVIAITPTGTPASYGVVQSDSGRFLDAVGELPPEYSRIPLVSQALVMPPVQSRILLMTDTIHYDNPGGKGDRTASVTMTTSASLLSGGMTFLINGTFGNDGWFNGSAAAGAWLQFQLSSARVITGLKLYQSWGATHGTWKPQGSNDGSSWTDLDIEQTLGGSSTTSEIAFYSNTTAYIYYRILGISGNTSSSPWIQEIEFKIDGGTVPTYGVKADAGIFQPLTYATVYEGEPLTAFGDSLDSWLDSLLLDFATPQLAFGESLDLWSEFVNYAIGGGIAVESDLNLWADSNSLFPSLNIADSLQMSDSVSYTMFEIMLPLFLSVADSMIKTTGPQPTRFEMKDGVSYFLDAADAPLFISVDDLETFLADAVAISFVVFFNSAEAEAFDSMQWNWADSVELDLIRGESFAEWMFQTDEISLLFDSLVGVGDSFNLSDAVSNAAITEDFAVDDSFTLSDSIEVMLFVSLFLAVGDWMFMSDSVIGMKNSANVSYLRRYLNDVIN